jgi:aminoglycoside 6'-N-acetyltransferase
VSTFEFRRLTRADFELVAHWLAAPHVARWWNHEFTPEALERDFGTSADGGEPSEDHLVLRDGEPIGLMQFARYRDYPEYADELAEVLTVPDGAVSIDYLIGDVALTGRRVGTAMIAAFVDGIWKAHPEATCVVVPVSSANHASWKALRAAGFHLAARGELDPDNPIDDRRHEIMWLDRPVD